MRRIPIALAALTCAACATVPATPPPPDRAVVPGTAAEAFACGMRLVNELGYVVADADRDAGFIRADRDRTTFAEAMFQGVETFDQLTLTVYPGEDGRTVLRVVPGGYEVEDRGDNVGGRVSRAGSEQAYADVQRILGACGQPLSPGVATAPQGGA